MRISVTTPTYNRANTLHRVFDSLINQTFQNFEWIVIDDDSFILNSFEILIKY